MEVSLVTMQQDLSLEDGSVTNFIVLRLPSGHMMRAVIADESVKLLVDNLASRGAFTPAPPQPPMRQPVGQDRPQRVNDEGAVVFGGDDDDEEEAPSWAQDGGVAMPPAGEPQPQRGTAWEAPPVQEPQRTVPMNADEQAQAYREGKKKQQTSKFGTQNGRTVPKDEAGYPITNSGGRDPGELMGGNAGDLDDDGVGSV